MCVQTEYFSWPTCRSRIEIIKLAYGSIFTRRREKDVMFYFRRGMMYVTVKPYILALLEGDPIRGKTKLIYQLFLIAEDIVKEKADFKFFPYQFGPYSNVVAQQLNSLIDQGHVKHTKGASIHLFELTDSGRELLEQQDLSTDIVEKIQSLKEATANHRIKDMIAIVRAKYPQYLINVRI